MDQATAIRSIAHVAARHRGLRLLVLFGSRARGDATVRSDWDLGYIADAGLDAEALLADLVATLHTDEVDLVNLERASGLVRFRAARDGVPVLEGTRDAFGSFWFDAVSFWCDAGPIIRAGYDDVLAELAR